MSNEIDNGPVTMRAEDRGRGFRIPPPPAAETSMHFDRPTVTAIGIDAGPANATITVEANYLTLEYTFYLGPRSTPALMSVTSNGRPNPHRGGYDLARRTAAHVMTERRAHRFERLTVAWTIGALNRLLNLGKGKR